MTRFASLLGLAMACAALALTGCDYFGTHDGLEEGDSPGWVVQGNASFEVVGASPSTTSEGEEVTVYAVSDANSPVDRFSVGDFWFCTFDGESQNIELGGNDYEAEVDADEVLEDPDIDVTESDLDGRTVSAVTFTIPDGTVTGESMVITPNATEYFHLTIQ